MARLGKRNRKFNGTRNHGKGNAKNRRGKGGKGGWGRAGMHKHRFSYVTTHERDWMAHGGRFGFVRQNAVAKLPAINVYEIDQMAQNGKLEKREGKFFFDFPGKVLGAGAIFVPVQVKSLAYSEGAAKKIKKAGGSIEAPAPKGQKQEEKKE